MKAIDSKRSVKKILDASSDYYFNSSEIKDLQENYNMSFFGDSELFRNGRFQKIIQSSLLREQRIKQAKILKEKLEIETKQKIHDEINRKSKGYKDALKRIKAENQEFNVKLKQLMIALNFELIYKVVIDIAINGFYIEK